MGRRKSSLTVEELEAGAEAEAAQKERMAEAGFVDRQGNSLLEKNNDDQGKKDPGTGLGGGAGLGDGAQRPSMRDGALGLAEHGGGSAIDDDAPDSS
jgi:hypothetical protein